MRKRKKKEKENWKQKNPKKTPRFFVTKTDKIELRRAEELRLLGAACDFEMNQTETDFCQMLDLWFQRQFHPQIPFGPYRADFLHFGGLVVELDGPYHKDRKYEDARRDAYFRQYGFETIRITNEEFFKTPGATLDKIKKALTNRLCAGYHCEIPIKGVAPPRLKRKFKMNTPLEIDSMPRPKRPPIAASDMA